MKISNHFTLDEFVNSDTAKREGYIEQYNPPQNIIDNLSLLAKKVADPIREQFGIWSPTCSYRCPRLNSHKTIKGASKSLHLTGQAFDETFIKNGKNISAEVFFWLLKSKVEWTKIIWEMGDYNTPRWLHIEHVPGAKKAIFYTFDKKSYLQYLGSEMHKGHQKLGLI